MLRLRAALGLVAFAAGLHCPKVAATHLGPRALALAAALDKGLRLTNRKTCAMLRALAGLTITPGGLSQALARMGRRLKPAHAAHVERVMAEPVLHTDETSWHLGGPGSSPRVMTSGAGTCCRIVPSRTKAAAMELLGDHRGVLVSDCLNLHGDLTPLQQKC